MNLKNTPSNNPDPPNAIDFHQELAPKWNQKYEKQIFEQRAARLRQILSKFTKRDEVWIDAGCGTGTIARTLVDLGVVVTGYDGSSAMVDISREQSATEIKDGRAKFEIVESIENLPTADEKVDGIVCSSVIEYVDDPAKCIREFNRVLRPDGSLVLTVPHRNSALAIVLRIVFWTTGKFTGNPRPTYMKFSKNHYSSKKLRELMSQNGFTEDTIDFTSFWPKWLPLKPFGGMCLYYGKKNSNVQ